MTDNNLKIFITGPYAAGKHKFANYLQDMLPDTFSVGKLTSTNPVYKAGGYFKYYNLNEIDKIFQNRQFLFINDGRGLTTTTLENNNLFVVSLEELLMIPEKVFAKNNVLLVLIIPEREEREQILRDEVKLYNPEEIYIKQNAIIHQVKNVLMMKKCLMLTGLSDLEKLIKIVKFMEMPDNHKKKMLSNTEIRI